MGHFLKGFDAVLHQLLCVNAHPVGGFLLDLAPQLQELRGEHDLFVEPYHHITGGIPHRGLPVGIGDNLLKTLSGSFIFFGRSRVPFFKAFFMVSLTLPVLVIYPFCSKCSSSSVASSWVTVCSSTVVIVLVIPIIASAACSAVAPFLIWRMTSVTGLGGSVISLIPIPL